MRPVLKLRPPKRPLVKNTQQRRILAVIDDWSPAGLEVAKTISAAQRKRSTKLQVTIKALKPYRGATVTADELGFLTIGWRGRLWPL